MKKIILVIGLVIGSCTPDQTIETFLNQSHEPPPTNWVSCQEIQKSYVDQIALLETNRTPANDSITTVKINQIKLIQNDCN